MTDELYPEDVYAPEIEVVESKRLVEGYVWDLRRDSFRFGDETLTRDYVDHTGAVGILALDENDRALLIRQYRHAVAHHEWEIPAGLMDVAGEPALEAAKRELTEETGLKASEWWLLQDYYTSPGGSNEVIRIFLARGLDEAETDFVRTGEEAEIVTRFVPLDTVVEAVLAGSVQDSILVVAALAAESARSRGWSTLRDPHTSWERRERMRGERSRG